MAGTVKRVKGRGNKTSLQWQLQVLAQDRGIFRDDAELRALLSADLADLRDCWKIELDGPKGRIRAQLLERLKECLGRITPKLPVPYKNNVRLFTDIFNMSFNITSHSKLQQTSLDDRRRRLVSALKGRSPSEKDRASASKVWRWQAYAIKLLDEQIRATGFVPQVHVSVFEKQQKSDRQSLNGLESSNESPRNINAEEKSAPQVPDSVAARLTEALKRRLTRRHVRVLALVLVGAMVFFISASSPVSVSSDSAVSIPTADESRPGWSDCIRVHRCFEMESGVEGSEPFSTWSGCIGGQGL